MIPKVINYCWFGRGEKSKLIKKCIKSWKRFCPTYEIREWNEDNFDINCCEYVSKAYQNKKWAFVSDYARHKIIFDNGGIYVDTDVEFLKPIDCLLDNNFLALEKGNIINTGLIMASEKGNKYFEDMLNIYKNESFILENGSLNLKSVCDRTTEYFMERGFKKENTVQKIQGFIIYPTEYFCPRDIFSNHKKITDNTFTFHHYEASWLSKRNKFKRKFISFIGEKNTNRILKIKNFLFRK